MTSSIQDAAYIKIKSNGKDDNADISVSGANVYVDIGETSSKEVVKLYREAELRPADASDMEGRQWDVTLIGANGPDDIITVNESRFLLSKNGRLYSVQSLKDSIPQWNGIKVFDNHLTDAEFEQKQGMRSPTTEWLGTIVDPYWDEERTQIRATFKVVEDSLASKLKNAWEAGVLSTVGLSIDTFPIIEREISYEGTLYPIIEGFNKILSVDLVGDPAAGGGFNRLIAATTTQEQMEIDMVKEEQDDLEKVLDKFLTEKLGDMIKSAVSDAMSNTSQEDEDNEDENQSESVSEDAESNVSSEDEQSESNDVSTIEDVETVVRQLEGRLLLKDKLSEAKLDKPYKDAVIDIFDGQVYEQEKLDGVIAKMQTAQAAKDPSGHVSESGTNRGNVQVGLTSEEKFEIEFMRMVMGATAFNELEHNKEDFVKDRIREGKTYKSWVNNGKPNTGNYRRVGDLVYDLYGYDPLLDNRMMEAGTTTTLSTVVKNTVNIFTAADYSLQQRWYEDVVNVEEVDTIDDTTLARLHGLDTLQVVEEGAAYLAIDPEDEEETATFVKRGNYISVTMETMMRDKLNFIRTIPRRLSDTWFNTLSSQTAAVFTTNSDAGPVLGTTGALFNATAVSSAGGHANLLTAALSFTAFGAARTAMRKQTSQTSGNGRRLQINPRYLLVPEDLESTAMQIRNSEQQTGTDFNDINPYYQQFDVITVPDWTDTNNWALVGDPARFPAIYHIFPRGNRTPQIFTADNEAAGAMFTNDSLRFKVRMMTYEFSSTYRVSPVAEFRSLHKNNVA